MTRHFWAVAVMTLAMAVPVRAQSVQNLVLRNSFNPTGAGARGLGMGGAFIAVADDGTAVGFNPAGLAQLRRTELAVVGFNDELTSSVMVPGSPDGIQDKSEHGALDFVGLAVPFEVGNRNLTLQLSYQRAVDLFGEGRATLIDTIDLSELDPSLSGMGEVVADVTPVQRGAFNSVSLAAAYQVSQPLYLGLSANYWFADWTASGTNSFRVRGRLDGSQTPINVPLVNTEFNQAQSMRGFNLNTGLLLKYPWLSLGGVVRFPFDGSYGLEENNLRSVFDEETGGLGDPVPVDYAVRSQLHFSWGVGTGIALRPFRGLTLAADYTWSEWSRTFITNLPGGALLTSELTGPGGAVLESFTDRNFFDLEPASQTTIENTSQWRAGGEYLLVFSKVIIPLRGGVFRDRSPITDLGTGEGRLIEGWTVGTGLNFNRFVFDIAFERRTSEGLLVLRLRQGIPTAGQATESVRQDRIVASVIYRAGGDDDPFKRLFRSIFGDPKEEDEEATTQ